MSSGPDFLFGDAAHRIESGYSSGAGGGTQKERYDLPWRFESLEDPSVDPATVKRMLGQLREDEGYDVIKVKEGAVAEEDEFLGKGSVIKVGDGKNVYAVGREDGFEGLGADGEITVECIGVCNPEMYDKITDGEGFEGVLKYMEGVHAESVEYDSRSGEFVYPESDFHDGAGSAFVDRAVENYEKEN